jgi:hypothetical protein
MEKYLLALLCNYSIDAETNVKCRKVIKDTIVQFHIYQTIKEMEKEYRELAEIKLSKPGFWALSTGISTISTQRLYLTGHNIMGIDSVNLRLGKDSEIALTWSF